MNPEDVARIVRQANREVEAEALDLQLRVQAERVAAWEAEQAKPSPADLIAAEWDELDEPYSDLDALR